MYVRVYVGAIHFENFCGSLKRILQEKQEELIVKEAKIIYKKNYLRDLT